MKILADNKKKNYCVSLMHKKKKKNTPLPLMLSVSLIIKLFE